MGQLYYRIPGQAVQAVSGEFFELELHQRDQFNGFVVTTAQGDRWFGFQEGKTVSAKYEMMRPFVASQQMYLDHASFFVEQIQSWGHGKAVLSRVKEVKEVKHDLISLFNALESNYPNAFCYAFSSDLLGTWMAATPETLVLQDGVQVCTMALAGTRRTDSTDAWEEKEYEEQGLVTAYVDAVLKEVGANATVSPREELVAGPVKHLINRFECELPRSSVYELIDLLHPTPAVSGLPLDNAQMLIARVEPHQRLFYSGIVGLQQSDKLNLYVNLRCAQLIKNDLYLYCGGGLTKDSDPMAEWQETENKAQTLLRVFENIETK